MKTMAELLKPCPFCGGYAFTGQFDYPSGYSVWHVYHMSDNCYLNGMLPDFETEEEAIGAWNRRAGEDDA
jgi:Lar family restriction alleviation protein